MGAGSLGFWRKPSWAQSGIQTGLDLVKGDEWEIFKPGVYTDKSKRFDKRPYLDQVPSMTGKCAAAHPLEGDIITNRGIVTDKYRKGDEYFVDLIWWCETFDNYIVQEGHATVKLPKME